MWLLLQDQRDHGVRKFTLPSNDSPTSGNHFKTSFTVSILGPWQLRGQSVLMLNFNADDSPGSTKQLIPGGSEPLLAPLDRFKFTLLVMLEKSELGDEGVESPQQYLKDAAKNLVQWGQGEHVSGFRTPIHQQLVAKPLVLLSTYFQKIPQVRDAIKDFRVDGIELPTSLNDKNINPFIEEISRNGFTFLVTTADQDVFDNIHALLINHLGEGFWHEIRDPYSRSEHPNRQIGDTLLKDDGKSRHYYSNGMLYMSFSVSGKDLQNRHDKDIVPRVFLNIPRARFDRFSIKIYLDINSSVNNQRKVTQEYLRQGALVLTRWSQGKYPNLEQPFLNGPLSILREFFAGSPRLQDTISELELSGPELPKGLDEITISQYSCVVHSSGFSFTAEMNNRDRWNELCRFCNTKWESVQEVKVTPTKFQQRWASHRWYWGRESEDTVLYFNPFPPFEGLDPPSRREPYLMFWIRGKTTDGGKKDLMAHGFNNIPAARYDQFVIKIYFVGSQVNHMELGMVKKTYKEAQRKAADAGRQALGF